MYIYIFERLHTYVGVDCVGVAVGGLRNSCWMTGWWHTTGTELATGRGTATGSGAIAATCCSMGGRGLRPALTITEGVGAVGAGGGCGCGGGVAVLAGVGVAVGRRGVSALFKMLQHS